MSETTTSDRVSSLSWWLAEAVPIEDCPPLEGEVAADICIVGGGYSGLWTALRLKQLDPSLTVVLVEANVCGSGASGRNGGFAMTMWHHFISLQQACGTEEAVRLAELSEGAVREIGSFCADNDIDADYRMAGWYWTAANEAQIGAWEQTMRAAERSGREPFAQVDRAELEQRTGSAAHIAGVFESVTATLQPAVLARGLLRAVGAQGVQVFEGSPMIRLDRSQPAVVHTPGGRVRATQVVLAMNAWSAQLRELRRSLVVVSSDIVITEPVPDLLAELGWDDGSAISDSRLMVHYYRTTSSGRIAFGKGGGRLAYGARIDRGFNGPTNMAAQLTSSLRSIYPQFSDTPIVASWAGPIDRAYDGLPFFMRLGPSVVCGAGYSGNGVAPSLLGGRILASMALGRSDEWSGCGLVRRPPASFPPEPIRYLGGRVVRGAVARKEHAQDRGRQPTRLDSGLASLAPAGLVPVD